jgi:hypothetical protein
LIRWAIISQSGPWWISREVNGFIAEGLKEYWRWLKKEEAIGRCLFRIEV